MGQKYLGWHWAAAKAPAAAIWQSSSEDGSAVPVLKGLSKVNYKEYPALYMNTLKLL